MAAPTVANASAAPDQDLAAAHQAVLADPNLQFAFPRQTMETPDPPAWLEPLINFIQYIAPFLNLIFWGGLIAVAALVIYIIVSDIVRRMPGRASTEAAPETPVPTYKPAPTRAQALLEEADRLAAEGRYSEAARVLLHRSIEDIERQFATTIGPSLTSREIAHIKPLSEHGRSVFSGIARAVEISLFGEQPLAAPQYAACREAYASFALKGGR
jgi:hypothetical protein